MKKLLLYYSDKSVECNRLIHYLTKNKINIDYVPIDNRIKMPNGKIYCVLPNQKNIPLLPEIQRIPTLQIFNNNKYELITGEEPIINFFSKNVEQNIAQATHGNMEPVAFSQDKIYSLINDRFDMNQEEQNLFNNDPIMTQESLNVNNFSNKNVDEMQKRINEMKEQREKDVPLPNNKQVPPKPDLFSQPFR
jgi:hypothetical protein